MRPPRRTGLTAAGWLVNVEIACYQKWRGGIGLVDANLPWAWETGPDTVCSIGTDALPAVAAENEELRHIPDLRR